MKSDMERLSLSLGMFMALFLLGFGEAEGLDSISRPAVEHPQKAEASSPKDRPPILGHIDDQVIVREEMLEITATAEDPDGFCSDLLFLFVPDAALPNPDYGGTDPAADYEVGIQSNGDCTADFWFRAGSSFVPPRDHDLSFTFTFVVRDADDETDQQEVTFTLEEYPFQVEVKKAFASPGQQDVRVPFLLSNPWAGLGGWEFLIEYDPSGGAVVGAELCDSAMMNLSLYGQLDTIFFYAQWFDDPSLRPEYFTCELNANGHANWVRVVGVQDLAWPEQVTPDLPRDQDRLLFCLVFDVSPEWDGHNVIFNFHTKNCTDNILTDSEGRELWGPHPDSPYPPSAPEWLNCPYQQTGDDVVYLLGGHGLGVRTVSRGDVNCDCVPYSAADAMMFLGFLVYGSDALSGCGDDFEVYCAAADIDADGYCLTVCDFIKLVRIINGYKFPIPVEIPPEEFLLVVRGGEVSVDREIGAVRLVFQGEGEVTGQDVAYAHRDGRTVVVAYTIEDRALSGELFTIDGDVKLESVEAGTFFGGPMVPHTWFQPEPPERFFLSTNYPNPFNPATVIRYELPRECHVRIEVYNILGHRVATLVDAHKGAGSHAVAWVADDAPSGVYICRIRAGKYTAARKMVRLK